VHFTPRAGKKLDPRGRRNKKKGKGKEEGGGEKEREEGERGVGGDCEVKEERGRERWDEKMK